MIKDTTIQVVILDLDQTITTEQGSWLQFTQILGSKPEKHIKIFRDFQVGKISQHHAKTELINLWKTVSTLEKDSLVEVFSQIKMREGVFDAVQYLKTKYQLCIISGAIDIFVDYIADRLGIEDRFTSTKFIFKNNILYDFEYLLDNGESKLGYLYKFCKKNKIEPSECAAIGDGESDMPIFEEIGFPILYIAENTTQEQKGLIKNHLYYWKDVSKFL